jgi:hypothetical protein
MAEEAGALVIGPGHEILSRTGDKLQARLLAEECQVPVLPALRTPTSDVAELGAFACSVGYPIIIKAVDGGGGHGIRIVRKEEDLASLTKRAIQESPSGKAFAEKAAINGFRHVEVQIIGDGKGNVRHLWERECSIQRRFQKVVEFAPSSIQDRKLVSEVIKAALRMANKAILQTFYSITISNRIGQLFLVGNIRVPCLFLATRILLSRSKSSFASGAYYYRVSCTWDRSGQNANTSCTRSTSVLPHHIQSLPGPRKSSTNIFSPAPGYSGRCFE